MKVTVFGASGRVGRIVVQKLLDDGWEVTAFVHKSSPFPKSGHVRIVRGDVHSLSDVKKAVSGNEVIISTLGSWGTKQKDIVSSGMANIISAMTASNVKRVISLTGSGAMAPGEQSSMVDRLSRAFIKLTPLGHILQDGEKHLELLQNSQLDWTVIRSPIMNSKGDPSRYNVGMVKPKALATINRQSVAIAMVGLIGDRKQSKKAPFITRAEA